MYHKASLPVVVLLLLVQAGAIAQVPTALMYGVGLEKGSDRLVSVVKPGSPAESAGVKIGDKVIMLDNSSTEGLDNTAIIQKLGFQYETTMVVERGGQSKWDPLESTCRHASLSIL